jgi:hypothetical protein
MKTFCHSKAFWLGIAVFVAGAVPALFYWFFFGQTPEASPTEMRTMNIFEQWLVIATAFGIKPLYMLISLALVVWLWRQPATDLAALRCGLIFFWLGEFACAVNYLFLGGHSNLLEFFHDYGMAAAFSFITFAVLEAIDVRVLKYSAPKERCAMLNLCRTCIKYADAPCKLHRVFAIAIPALVVVAIMPLCATLKVVSYNVTIFGSIQNYSHGLSSQLFESRYCAILAIVFLTASWLVLLFKRDDPVTPAKILFSAAMGPLSFGLMRLFLYSAYNDNLLWFEEWEEITELLFIMATACLLWLFRHSLFDNRAAAGNSPAIDSDRI